MTIDMIHDDDHHAHKLVNYGGNFDDDDDDDRDADDGDDDGYDDGTCFV